MITKKQFNTPGLRFITNTNNSFPIGTIVKKYRDDGTMEPKFVDERGVELYERLDLVDVYEKTIDNLEEGDLLKDEDGEFARVLAVIGNGIYLLSEVSEDLEDDELKTAGEIFTAFELKDNDWQLEVKDEGVEELTVEEVSKRLGKTVKIVK